MIARMLSLLFPPQLPGQIRDWQERTEENFEEQGSAGPARPKQFRNGIERHFAEEKLQRYRINSRQYISQLMYVEVEMEKIERDLLAQGYVNTIHDCWEKET